MGFKEIQRQCARSKLDGDPHRSHLHRARGQQEVKVTEGLFTLVALDEEHKPRALPEG